MADFHFVHPGDLATRTGGYRYARSLLEALRRRGVVAQVHRLADSFPFPDARALADADRTLAGIADGGTVVVDGLALGAMPIQAAAHAARLKLVALVHHPLALETGLDPVAAAALASTEREALRHVRAVVVTSPATALALQDYGVAATRITVVLPGTEQSNASSPAVASSAPAPFAPAPPVPVPKPSSPVRLLCVASVTPRKGQLELVEALAALGAREPALSWRLVCIGGLDRDPAYAAAVHARVLELGLDEQVQLVGERDEAGVDRAYDEADVFVLASHHEGYGMVLAEALAKGLPVVSTTAGAIPQTVPADAARLVPAGDVNRLADALAEVVGSLEKRRAMAAASRRAARSLPTWDTAGERFVRVLQSVAAPRRGGVPVSGSVGGLPPAPAGFTASWLALREPFDHAARSAALTRQLAEFLREAGTGTASRPVRILDLGCGTGSTLRYLGTRLGNVQQWTLVDNDPELLDSLAPPSLQGMATQAALAPVCLDLAVEVERLPFENVDLVTASALLDLVSAQWLDRLLAGASAGARAGGTGQRLPAMLLALSYDGQIAWQPPHPDDRWATDLFNRHQRGDKGFGPALGPTAAEQAAQFLRMAGWRLAIAPSPWRLGPADVAVQREFLGGVASAARAMAEAGEAARLQAWVERREGWLAQGMSAVEVGHLDLLALPAEADGHE